MSDRGGWVARGAIAAWLTTMWVLLWGSLTLPNVVVGAVVAAGVLVVFPPPATNDDPIVIRPLRAAWFVLWFLWQLVVTNLAVARVALVPTERTAIRTGVVACQLRTASGRLATIIANAITLTPGTLTLDARSRPSVLFVHVLSYGSIEATRAEVADLERRVVEAFGTAEEVALLAAWTGPAPDPGVGLGELPGEVDR